MAHNVSLAMPSSAANKVEHRKTLWKLLLRARIWRDTHGQDMIEYGLLAGFITVTVAATFPPAASRLLGCEYQPRRDAPNL